MTPEEIATHIDAEIQSCDDFTPEENVRHGFGASDMPHFDGWRSALTLMKREAQGQTVETVMACLDRKITSIYAADVYFTSQLSAADINGFLAGLRDSLIKLETWITGDDDGGTN
jgi:hypothetical protein